MSVSQVEQKAPARPRLEISVASVDDIAGSLERVTQSMLDEQLEMRVARVAVSTLRGALEAKKLKLSALRMAEKLDDKRWAERLRPAVLDDMISGAMPRIEQE